MEGILKNIVTGLAQRLFTGLAAAILSYGILVPGQSATQETDAIVGSGMFIVALAFAAYDEYKSGKLVKTGLQIAADTGQVPPVAVVKAVQFAK